MTLYIKIQIGKQCKRRKSYCVGGGDKRRGATKPKHFSLKKLEFFKAAVISSHDPDKWVQQYTPQFLHTSKNIPSPIAKKP